MSEPQTFWEHLDELRGSLIKMIAAVVLFSIIAFFFKDIIFEVILGPKGNDFITYRVLEDISSMLFKDSVSIEDMDVKLINTGLAQQFMIHIKASVCAGILVTSPYLLYLLFHFISPALYSHERKCAIQIVSSGYIMFIAGVLLSYFLIFPLTFRFLGTYQISDMVENTVTIESYIDTLMMISLSMGLIFEIPIVCWILGRMGIISTKIMEKYRRHVVVVLLIIAAIITPTSDVFTLMLVTLPMWMLYEISIIIVKTTEKRGSRNLI